MTKRLGVTLAALLCLEVPGAAHSGPPYPIVTERAIGHYVVSVWTDPDATSDGSRGGQFWVVLHEGAGRAAAESTRVEVSVKPLDRDGSSERADGTAVNGDPTRRFVALPLDHEGPFAVTVGMSGPSGRASLDATVQATYNARPSPYLIGVYLLPFVLVGALWIKLMVRRRTANMAPR
jgi:hypothetical protein